MKPLTFTQFYIFANADQLRRRRVDVLPTSAVAMHAINSCAIDHRPHTHTRQHTHTQLNNRRLLMDLDFNDYTWITLSADHQSPYLMPGAVGMRCKKRHRILIYS
jgi:hypothetical protein